ncbi:uncharacterized protein [Prorops nasuta]|uniref:uncharacterized protein isoform X2 n=1 Tax=Prorops nasuta TaxID=863751 RepID=UPI0034CD3606
MRRCTQTIRFGCFDNDERRRGRKMDPPEKEKPLVRDLNEHIVCPLCRGYLIDATTLGECLHSFCRGCIARRLSSGGRSCPVCNVAMSSALLLPDLKLQRLVYLVVPGLYRSELEKRRHFRSVNPQCAPLSTPFGALDLTLDDFVSLSLRELTDIDPDNRKHKDKEEGHVVGPVCARVRQQCTSRLEQRLRHLTNHEEKQFSSPTATRYLKCPAGVTVRHLVRLLMLKRGWEEANSTISMVYKIEMMCEDQSITRHSRNNSNSGRSMLPLDPSWTLLDLACIFGWKREAPMRLFYRVLRNAEAEFNAQLSSLENGANPDGMENIQRPPTPPPSPKSTQEQIEEEEREEVVGADQQQQQQQQKDMGFQAEEVEEEMEEAELEPDGTLEGPLNKCFKKLEENALETSSKILKEESARDTKELDGSRGLESYAKRDKETKNKKPRCEVTPVMRAPDRRSGGLIQGCSSNHSTDSARSKELGRLEHRKRRKRRNKRVIAEITTTPREDLLKLKLRLTPCPPRITSTSATGQGKEKLLQMRAVRREKMKGTSGAASDSNQQQPQQQHQQRVVLLEAENKSSIEPPAIVEPEETIEDIIDAIPDEVVRIAQNIGSQSEETNKARLKMKVKVKGCEEKKTIKADENRKDEIPKLVKVTTIVQGNEKESGEMERNGPKKDEEILRRLGLVAINEAKESMRDKSKQRSRDNSERTGSLDQAKLEKQLRESKANRVRSLLAEKQMRDALKSIMSKKKEETTNSGNPMEGQASVTQSQKKKGPPPLAPLHAVKQSSNFTTGINAQLVIDRNNASKYEKPLDLSSAAATSVVPAENALDLSASLSVTTTTAASLSSSPSSFSSSSSSSSSCSPPSSFSSGPGSSLICGRSSARPMITATSFLHQRKPKDSLENRRGQDSNLRTLSDAAVSLLSDCIGSEGRKAAPIDPLVIGAASIGVSKVALRIPQPHQRITGFGMKIKPNLGVRHIPNPQAVVASQYRNQRATYFTALSQQPP